MKRALLYILVLLLPLAMMADDNDLEYQMELGGGVGPCFYMGDANHTPFKHMSMMGGAVVRRVFNPRMVVKGDLAFGHVSGNSGSAFIPTDATSKTVEGGLPTSVSFKRNLLDLGAQFEFNFWGYGTGAGYKGNSRITPYILAGGGLTLVLGEGSTDLAFNIPVGVGVKYKVKPRLNVGMEWTFRFTTTDKLDWSKNAPQLDEPYNTHSAMFKNKDSYSFLMFYVTYDMCPKYRKCNN